MKRAPFSSFSSASLFSRTSASCFFLFLMFFSSIDAAPSPSSFYQIVFSRFSTAPPRPSSPPPSSTHGLPSTSSKAPTRRDDWEVGAVCNCSSEQTCCYSNDTPFCCGASTICCGVGDGRGPLCCPEGGVCCRSRSWAGVASCCSSSQYCTSTGDCSVMPLNRNNDWSLLPLMIGSFVMTFVVCCCTCVCISRINRRRAMLAAAAANPALLGHLSTNSAYRTFQPRGSYSKSQGVTAKMLQTFPTQSYHPGCMPAENAQCSICLLEYEPGDRFRTLPCKHHFHQPCIDRWLSEHDTCPLCIQVVTVSTRIDK